jgi:hypothetical protein
MKVRKTFLKPIAILMAVCMLFQLIGVAIAEGEEGFTEIIVEDVDCQTEQLIIDMINGEATTSDSQAINPSSILCIFGHSTAQTTIREINHRHWATAPRCRDTTYNVTYCTRSSCNYIVMTVRSQNRIHCCS